MDEILTNLSSPAWWFTGVFFVALLKGVTKITAILKAQAKKFFRGLRLKQAKYIKSNRHNIAAVNYQSIKAQAFFVVYMLVCSLYLIWYVSGPMIQIKKESSVLFFICLIPMITFQIIWMNHNDNAKILVSEHNKVRIKKSQSK
ncbi:hypothetical protein ACKC5O_00535 [Aeromonas schubertii]|uniref:hypothetical protein n=1 Tax=Aeromonas schubertii TaxID=652 RepID=UPI0038B505DE